LYRIRFGGLSLHKQLANQDNPDRRQRQRSQMRQAERPTSGW